MKSSQALALLVIATGGLLICSNAADQARTRVVDHPQKNLNGSLLVLSVDSLNYKGVNPRTPSIFSTEQCANYCKVLPGCNGFDYCGQLEGCYGYCFDFIGKHPKLRPGPDGVSLGPISLPIEGLGPWPYPPLGCQSKEVDRWPRGQCTLLAVPDPEKPIFWNDPVGNGSWTSAVLFIPPQCGKEVAAGACDLCLNSEDPQGCLQCARNSTIDLRELLTGGGSGSSRSGQEACGRCARLKSAEARVKCWSCLLGQQPCAECAYQKDEKFDIAKCLACPTGNCSSPAAAVPPPTNRTAVESRNPSGTDRSQPQTNVTSPPPKEVAPEQQSTASASRMARLATIAAVTVVVAVIVIAIVLFFTVRYVRRRSREESEREREEERRVASAQTDMEKGFLGAGPPVGSSPSGGWDEDEDVVMTIKSGTTPPRPSSQDPQKVPQEDVKAPTTPTCSPGKRVPEATSPVGLVGVTAPSAMRLPTVSPGVGVGGTTTTPTTTTAGPGTFPMETTAMLPALLCVCYLAAEIVAAGDRVVANHVRCKRIARRIATMQPMLTMLQGALERGEVRADLVQPLIERIKVVMEDCMAVMKKWQAKGEGSFSLMNAMLKSRDYEREFLDLNERLSSAYNDLALVLQVHRTLEDRMGGHKVPSEVKGDTIKDLQAMAKAMATDGQLWSKLTEEERQQLAAAYQEQGLDLMEIVEQLRVQARQQYIDSRMGDLIIKWKDIHLEYLIGSGGFGEVHKATWQRNAVAVKVLQAGVRTARLENSLKREAYIMTQLRHPHVAVCYGMVMEPSVLALVMAYYPKGTLTQLLQDDSTDLDWREKYVLALDVAEGMSYLHNRPFEPVIHGDLKSSNLLLDANHQVVITDFGLSKVQTLSSSTRTAKDISSMSMVYAAPELMIDPTHPKTQAADVYAFGMLMYEIATRHEPFPNSLPVIIMNHVTNGGRPPIPEGIPTRYQNLMTSCWAQTPAARPMFEELVENLATLCREETT